MATTRKNSFKELGKAMEEQIPHAPSKDIEKSVMGNIRVLKIFGDITELYLPRVIDIFISLVGGKTNNSATLPSGGESAKEIDTPHGDANKHHSKEEL